VGNTKKPVQQCGASGNHDDSRHEPASLAHIRPVNAVALEHIRPVCTENLNPNVMMMKPAKDWV
jgi:hypothetical protein